MFSIGDKVECISGRNKGKIGEVLRYSTNWEGKPRIIVSFDDGAYQANLWEHRFILYHEWSKEELVILKVRAMEKRQTWQKNPA